MKKALLTVSFGTSHLDTLDKTIAAIERDVAAAMPGREARRAFTSGMIIKKLRERDGIVIPNVSEALASLAEEGFGDVVIQPTHILNGEEFEKLMRGETLPEKEQEVLPGTEEAEKEQAPEEQEAPKPEE